MGAWNRQRMMAAGGIAAAIALPGAIRLYQVNRTPDADLVITGRTGPETRLLPSAGAQPAVVRAVSTAQQPIAPAPPAEVVVHVAGAVKKPGVYHLTPTARAEDAVKAAGGKTAAAYLDAINLAAHVEDGEQLYVPNKNEQSTGGATPAPQTAAPKSKSAAKPGGTSHGNKLTRPGQGTVNLNTASAEELKRLPGVGDAMAVRILDYRKTNGGFRQIEQLMDVSGIGPKKFEKMKPCVRVK